MGIRAVLAGNLRRLRAEIGISQEELAYRAGIDRSYISKIECEAYGASVDKVEKMAKVLKVDPSDLLARHTRPAKSRGS
jgi:transcriptional regulator with XRE-family HTH domain